MQILIRRFGRLLELSDGYKLPLNPEIAALLTPDMVYTYRELMRGHRDVDPIDGNRSSVRCTPKRMYDFDDYGRLICGLGYLPRISRTLQTAGHSASYDDVTPESPRPGCYIPDWDNVHRYIQFRPRQEECLQAMVRHEFGGVIKATMGFGKSELIAAFGLLYPRARIDIVVEGLELVNSLQTRLTRYLPNIGRVGGGRPTWSRVTVISADSLSHSDGKADFLLGDEVHKLMAPEASQEIGARYMFSRNFGLSGTPQGRFDGADAKMEALFGPVIFELSYSEGIELGLVVPIFVRWVPVNMDDNPVHNKTGVPRKRWGIWRNETRNMIIADTAREFPDRQALILVETIEHAVFLGSYLPEFSLCYGKMDESDLDFYKRNGRVPQDYQPVTPETRERMRKEFEAGTLRKVIATDVWSTGVDFPHLSVLLRGDERDGEIQSSQGPARPSRLQDGKEYAIVIDFVDNFDTKLKAKARSRYRRYKSLGWEQDWPEGRRQISEGTLPAAGSRARPRPRRQDASEPA